MNDLQVFNFKNNNIRSLMINNDPWFIGKDVAVALGYNNPRDAIKKHVYEDDKNTVAIHDGIVGNPNMTIINESGLYALIFGSKLDKAKEFKHWVTSEVLPQIRKTGSYGNSEKLRLAEIISRTPVENLPYLRELYPNYFKRSPGSTLERLSDENTSYQSWLNDYNVSRDYISRFPTTDIFNDYVTYCHERHMFNLGKKTFYRQLEYDFGLRRRQKSDGYRYYV